MPNRLANETSPYLLQHRDNPVDWYPWGEEALARARDEDKPLLVSIGYSACHWCHVMAHESFENPEIAWEMNERFVCVKVDREERPDLDAIYMTAVQAIAGQGGWPLNVFLTPEGLPFYGGTYWPPEDRRGMPGFPKVLAAVSDAYQNRKDETLESAEQVSSFLDRAMRGLPSPNRVSPETLDEAFRALLPAFDDVNGGFGRAPKFPQASVIDFLLRYAKRTHAPEAEEMVRLTLDKMAAGGVHDQIGGGFHRYAVDAVWLVPHFEKMLYDNAQLALLYLDAYRAFRDPGHRRVAERMLDYVLREMTSPEGGFYAAEDADSEGEEGRFYVWTAAEVDDLLGEDAALVSCYFDVEPGGNFEGRSILNVPRPLHEVAAEFGLSEEDAAAAIGAASATLLAARNQRVRPGRDEKVLAAWNGLTLKALATAGRALGRDDYLWAAVANAKFLLGTMRVDGRMRRTFTNGEARGDGFLEDHAFVADGLLTLYGATLDPRWLDEAVSLVETIVSDFADPSSAGFYDTGIGHERLIARPRDLQDGALPSGNAVTADLLVRLGALTGREEWSRRGVKLLEAMADPMAEQPSGFGRFLSALDFHLAEPSELVIAGKPGDAGVGALLGAEAGEYLPNLLVAGADPDDDDAARRVPMVAGRTPRDGAATAYVCQNFACQLPVTEPEAMLAQIRRGAAVAWREL